VPNSLSSIGVTLIAAMDCNNVIGKDGKLPWSIPEDLKQFKADTMNQPMIMGRKTFESIGRVLPGRDTIVITSDTEYRATGVTKVSDLQEAIYIARLYAYNNCVDNVNVVGGSRVFEESMQYATRLLLTQIVGILIEDGDSFFPRIPQKYWHLLNQEITDLDAVSLIRSEYVRI
jgi:dihydrofolate reductase